MLFRTVLLATPTSLAVPLTAEGDLRLVNGTSSSGRLEIHHSSFWGTVCSNGFTHVSASVACRQLGFESGTFAGTYPTSPFGPGAGPIWLSDVQCAGSESTLTACPSGGWDSNYCRHDYDVGVYCGGTTKSPSPGSGVWLRSPHSRRILLWLMMCYREAGFSEGCLA